jgi:hypothetical protein
VDDVHDNCWNEIPIQKLIGFLIGIALFAVLVLKSEPGFVLFLDHANLVFHEAGHPAVGLFSQRLETYGGTMGRTDVSGGAGCFILAEKRSDLLCRFGHLVL